MKQHEEIQKKAKKAKEFTDAVALQNNLTVEDLTQGLLNYKQLGLDFQKAENESLRYVSEEKKDRSFAHNVALSRFFFSQIDEADPDRKYTFVLAFVDDHWKVSECECIDPAVISPLVSVLDEKNDVGQFVRAMRKAFIDSIE